MGLWASSSAAGPHTGLPRTRTRSTVAAVSDDYAVLVGGDRAAGADGTYDIINPATEAVVGRAPEVSVGQVEAATQAAAEAFPSWSRTSPQQRSDLLTRLADLLAEQAHELLPPV